MKKEVVLAGFLKGPPPHCFRCGTSMKPKSIRLGGMSVRAWRCPKDGEEILHPDDAEIALMLNKLRRHGVKVSIGILNKAPYIRFPKEFNLLFHKGDEIVVKMISAKTMEMSVVHRALSGPSSED
jgi:hypothetical protein